MTIMLYVLKRFLFLTSYLYSSFHRTLCFHKFFGALFYFYWLMSVISFIADR
jgi:hypothetical protein